MWVSFRRRSLALLGGFAFFVSVFVYPSFVLGVAIIYFSLGARHWFKFRQFPKDLGIAAVFSGCLFFAFWALTIFRFPLSKIIQSIETTKAYGSGNMDVLDFC